MKKTLAKILAIVLCAILLVSGTIYITLAYLQSQSNIVQNTFTVSDIKLKLDETEVDLNGVAADPPQKTETGNEYKLVPGKSYTKDPTVHVVDGSEDCYIVIAIHDALFNGTNDNQADYEGKGCIYGEGGQMYKLGWRELTGYKIHSDYLNATDSPMQDWGDAYKLYYYAGKTESEGETSTDAIVTAGEDLTIFEGFTLSSEVDADTLEQRLEDADATFDVVAFGMQTTGYGDEFDAATGATKIGIAFDATFGEPINP